MNIVFDNRKIGYIQKMCCRLHSMLVTASALRAAVGDQWLGGAAHLAPASCWLRWTLGQGQRARKPPGGELELEVESGDQLMMMGSSSSVGSWRPERRHPPHSPSQDTIFILFYPRPPVSQSWSSSFTSLYFSWSSFQPLYKLKGG